MPTFVITGCSSGIGLDLVKTLANRGEKVFALVRQRAGSQSGTDELSQIVGDVHIIEGLDVASDDIGAALAASPLANVPIDCLVNNAGITVDNLSIRLTEENWKKVLDINLTSTFLMCKYAIKKMLKNKYGKIINITSIVGHTGNLGQANYAASKAGIIAFSKSLAIEYAKKNININCVSPGFIKTEMTDKINEEFKKTLISKIPSGDLGTGEDISNCVAFLASDMSRYINGETIHVNGGMYMA